MPQNPLRNSDNATGFWAAFRGHQLVRQSDGTWSTEESEYYFQRTDQTERWSDIVAVAWFALISVVTASLTLTGLTIDPKNGVVVLAIQYIIRKLLNLREYFQAQNGSINKVAKTTINITIGLIYITAVPLVYLEGAFSTLALPFVAFAVSSIRFIQGMTYFLGNRYLGQQVDPDWSPLQYSRYEIQRTKRGIQAFASFAVLSLSIPLCFLGYSVGIPGLFIASLVVGAINVGALLYTVAREYPPAAEFFRTTSRKFRSLLRLKTTENLNVADAKTMNEVVNPEEHGIELTAPAPTKHQLFLRMEDWDRKVKRLRDGIYYDKKTGQDYPKGEKPFKYLFAPDVIQEMDAIFAIPDSTRSLQEKKNLCRGYLTRLIQEEKERLEEEIRKKMASPTYERVREFLLIKAKTDRVQIKIYFFDCLQHLINTENGTIPSHNTQHPDSPFKNIQTYNELSDYLTQYPEIATHVFAGFFRKRSGAEDAFRFLCPGKLTATYSSRGYFHHLAESKKTVQTTAIKVEAAAIYVATAPISIQETVLKQEEKVKSHSLSTSPTTAFSHKVASNEYEQHNEVRSMSTDSKKNSPSRDSASTEEEWEDLSVHFTVPLIPENSSTSNFFPSKNHSFSRGSSSTLTDKSYSPYSPQRNRASTSPADETDEKKTRKPGQPGPLEFPENSEDVTKVPSRLCQ